MQTIAEWLGIIPECKTRTNRECKEAIRGSGLAVLGDAGAAPGGGWQVRIWNPKHGVDSSATHTIRGATENRAFNAAADFCERIKGKSQ